MIIDAHGHLLPEVMLEELADSKSRFPSIQVERTDGSGTTSCSFVIGV